MKTKNSLVYYLLFVLLLVNNLSVFSQCAMCKASVESDLNTGGSIGKELNTGILYLMAIPYLILMAGGYYFFKKPIDAKIQKWRVKYFPSKE